MGIIGWIIVIVIAMGIIGALFEWIFDHIIPILVLTITVVGLIFWTKGTIIMAGIALAIYGGYYLYNNGGKRNISKYLSSQSEKKEKAKLEKAQRDYDARKSKEIAKLPEKAQEVLQEGESFKKEITKYKETITDEDMLFAIKGFEETVDDLLNIILEKPDNAYKLNKLMSYYLPTITKLLGNYGKYASGCDDNSKKMAEEIKNTVIELDKAMENLLSEINMTDDWDVMADISVMRQMIERDGLSK